MFNFLHLLILLPIREYYLAKFMIVEKLRLLQIIAVCKLPATVSIKNRGSLTGRMPATNRKIDYRNKLKNFVTNISKYRKKYYGIIDGITALVNFFFNS